MASVIREGGKEPITANSWQNAVKSVLLDCIYDHGAHVANLYDYVEGHLNHEYIQKKYGHKITRSDVEILVKEMFRDGWIKGSHFVCECCKLRSLSSEEVLNHVLRFVLTEMGYDKVQEHIFP